MTALIDSMCMCLWGVNCVLVCGCDRMGECIGV